METKKKIIITGGTRGIGKALVYEFCQAGYHVIFTYKSSNELAKEIVQVQAEKGHLAIGYQCDATDKNAVDDFAQSLIAQGETIYGIINNAGITKDTLFANMKAEDWHSVIDTNLHSVYNITRAFVSNMMEQGEGVILNISSLSGYRGNLGQTNYSASKAAINGFTKSLSLELARFKVRVNTIAPGFIETEMLQSMPIEKRKSLKKSIPMRRLGSTRDVAALALFLASEDATYITGQSILIDGGLSV